MKRGASCLLKILDMANIVKENGNVYLVIEHDVYGRHITKRFLGKEYVEEEKENVVKTKKKNKSED